jgi:hypothetical protein
MISDSTKTAQTLVMRNGASDFMDKGPIISSGTPRVLAAASRKRPVPAAHLSFMTKSATLPSG